MNPLGRRGRWAERETGGPARGLRLPRGKVLSVAVVSGALVLASCVPSTTGSGGGGGNGGGGEQTTLTVWSWRQDDSEAYNAIFDVYEKKHPNITVKFKAFKETAYNTKLKTGLSAAGGPDVAQLRAYGELQPLVAANRLVPLDGKVDVSNIPDAVLEGAQGREDGKLYGVPVAIQTLQVFYNKKIFAKYGISEPKTWDQMLSAAKKLKSHEIIPFSTTGKDTWMLPIVREVFGAARAGGKKFEQTVLSGKTDFTDSDYVASLKLMKKLQPYFPDNVIGVPYTDAQVLFTSGKAAMYPGGSFELGPFTDQNSDLEMGVFQAPPPPGSVIDHPVTPGWMDNSYGVNAKSKHKKAALDLMRWMATKQFGQLFTDKVKQISPVHGVEPKNPLLAEMVTNYRKNPAPYTMLIDFRYGEPHGDDVEAKGIQSIFLGKKKAKEVAQNVQQGVSKWFEPKG